MPLTLALGAVCAVMVSCYEPPIPDQSGFPPLSVLKDGGQAVARLYSAPLQIIGAIASHPWFVIKAEDDTDFERWEVSLQAGGPFGHVQRDLMEPESGVGAGGVYIIAELTGDAAQAVVSFIRNESPGYPCRDTYILLGPNSNTYAQWVLDNTGWEVELPSTGIGKDAPVNCP